MLPRWSLALEQRQLRIAVINPYTSRTHLTGALLSRRDGDPLYRLGGRPSTILSSPVPHSS